MPHQPSRVDKILRRVSRVTSSGRFIPEIDGLRFFAIALVVLFHLRSYALWVRPAETYAINANADWLARLTTHGHYGVQLFFIISGFILALPFAAHQLTGARRVSLGGYYLRRLTRLEPPYIVCMVGIFLFLVFVARSWVLYGADMSNVPASARFVALLPSLFASLIYQHNLIFGQESFINFVAWSLEIEVQFYLLVPLLVGVFRITSPTLRRLVLAAVCLGLVALQVRFVPQFPIVHLTILGHLQYFLLGFLLADLFLVDWYERPAHGYRWDFAALMFWIALFAAWETERFAAYLTPFLMFGLYVAAFHGRIWNRICTNRWLVVIGGMCYSIYLIHAFALTRLGPLSEPFLFTNLFAVQYIIRALVLLPPLLAIAAVYFVLIERPCMQRDWPQRLWRQLRTMKRVDSRMIRRH